MRESRLKKRRSNWQDEDPLSGMANLFDLAMVFAVALMVALVVRFEMIEMLTQADFTIVKNPGTEDMEIIIRKGEEIERYTATDAAGDGRGRRVGVAYQLEDGRIIYVPETEDPPSAENGE